MSDNIKNIDELKKLVDSIDVQIIEQILERKKLTSQILELKYESGKNLKDETRENQIISRLIDIYGSNYENLINNIYKLIFSDSIANHKIKFAQSKVKTVFEGLQSRPLIIAGPCSVESKEQILRIAEELTENGIKFLRGGAFKPRTSPDSFQGIGAKGIEYLRYAADKTNMFVVSEVLETDQLRQNYDKIDVIQIGSRNMGSYGFLKEVGKITAKDKKPVLLKRGFNATLNEFLLAARYILDMGNTNLILCLRGIRTFEQIDSLMRYTPDLSSILELKELTDLPVLFDPSHSTGDSRFVAKIGSAALKLGADGLLVETHYDPKNALSDAQQCILPSELIGILNKL